jgi:hypothetical protein
MTEYGGHFNKLVRYAPSDVWTDAKRQSEFIRGLNNELLLQLVAIIFNNYQQLFDTVVIVEQHEDPQHEERYRRVYCFMWRMQQVKTEASITIAIFTHTWMEMGMIILWLINSLEKHIMMYNSADCE